VGLRTGRPFDRWDGSDGWVAFLAHSRFLAFLVLNPVSGGSKQRLRFGVPCG
jgi:hypothetical protein